MVQHTDNGAVPPLRTFVYGFAVGLAAALPLVIVALFVLSRVGIGDPTSSFSRIARFAYAFSGLPAAITCGGVARSIAARALRLRDPTFRGAALAGAIGLAPAGAGLLLIAALPLGRLPEEPLAWAWLAVAGGLAGALGGVVTARAALLALAVTDRARRPRATRSETPTNASETLVAPPAPAHPPTNASETLVGSPAPAQSPDEPNASALTNASETLVGSAAPAQSPDEPNTSALTNASETLVGSAASEQAAAASEAGRGIDRGPARAEKGRVRKRKGKRGRKSKKARQS
jgi:hypothetical protein